MGAGERLYDGGCAGKRPKKATPTAGVLDSQSVKNAATSTARVGYDAGKRITGRKRFFVVDTQGNLLAAWVTSAACHDGTTATLWWDGVVPHNELPADLRLLWVDQTFRARMQAALPEHQLTVCTPDEVASNKGAFCIHVRRWVVERTIARTSAHRRLARDDERTTRNAAACIYIANIRRILKLT